jgi:hypothetical protein
MAKRKPDINKKLENLRLNFGAICAFEDLHGTSLFEALGMDSSNEDGIELTKLMFGTVAKIIWAGRIAGEPELTPEQNMKSIANLNPALIIKAATNALAKSISDGDLKEGGDSETPGQGEEEA